MTIAALNTANWLLMMLSGVLLTAPWARAWWAAWRTRQPGRPVDEPADLVEFIAALIGGGAIGFAIAGLSA